MTRLELSQLVAETTTVCEGTLDATSLRRHIAAMARYVAYHGGGDWLLHEPDIFWFSVCLYGVTLGGGSITLLPDAHSTKQLAPSLISTDVMVRQVGLYFTNNQDHSSITLNDMDDESLPDIRPGIIIVLTSGSTGVRKQLSRYLHTFLEEASTLQGKWSLNDSIVTVSMVSHHHMYGLMFGVLWPLSCGARVLQAAPFPVPDISTLDNTVNRKICLISSPTYIHRASKSFALANLVDLYDHPVKIDRVFSAGSPLDNEKSSIVSKLLSCPVHEIYGSSETGAVATRRADIDSSWEALPGVDLQITEGRLTIQANYHAREVASKYLSSDLVESVGQSFKLVCRVDRVVKVEGKRVSLQEIENLVQQIECVESCTAKLHEDMRISVALAVVLTEKGLGILRSEGKQHVDRLLRHVLAESLEAVLVPRVIRYLGALPVNAQGKIDHGLLSAAFTEGARFLPSVLEVNRDVSSVRIKILIDPDLYVLDGHFQETAIVPGVALVHWAMRFAQAYLGVNPNVRRLINLKFMQVLHPLDQLDLSLAVSDSQLQTQYMRNGIICSKGIIELDA